MSPSFRWVCMVALGLALSSGCRAMTAGGKDPKVHGVSLDHLPSYPMDQVPPEIAAQTAAAQAAKADPHAALHAGEGHGHDHDHNHGLEAPRPTRKTTRQ